MQQTSDLESTRVDNSFYNELGSSWFDADDHPIAFLRAESKVKVSYCTKVLEAEGFAAPTKILDIACRAGLVSLPLAEQGFQVVGVDQSAGSLSVASQRAEDRKFSNCVFQSMNAYELEYADDSFDLCLLFDCLEHFDYPRRSIEEALRVLRPGGLLFFHTFNRTIESYLLAVKAIDWLTREHQPHIHSYDMFIKPSEMTSWLADAGANVKEIVGVRPEIRWRAFLHLLSRREVPQDFAFKTWRNLRTGYIGYAVKSSSRNKF